MKLSALLLLLLTAYAAHGAVVPRALWQFGMMIQCTQPGVNPFIYNNYGCWCGFGGSGTPRDNIDRCCEVHDHCYRAARLLPECRPIVDVPYIKVYDFSCSNTQVSCSGNKRGDKAPRETNVFVSKQFSSKPDRQSLLTTESNDVCQAAVCECDRVAAHCFAQQTYNSENKNLDRDVHCVN
ncbi:hypothetical protein JZ751_001395 [Albula glossodonta]|uniref:Phospholipase A2 n=1 Tax=Albula glossodonta TaxID=121402 RepID=A0A8T2PTB3_9TELE|nr:hypothetical protein JZ751_001395 [Albula glossodonta]